MILVEYSSTGVWNGDKTILTTLIKLICNFYSLVNFYIPVELIFYFYFDIILFFFIYIHTYLSRCLIKDYYMSMIRELVDRDDRT